MARIAVHRSVCAKKRKAVVVLLDLLDLNVPALHVVALFAAGSELPLMNIGVTVGALPAHIGEDRLRVALRAGNALVHSAQGEARGVVIKFWNSPNRLPAFERVAVLARDAEWAVWAARRRLRLCLPGRRLLRQNRTHHQRTKQQ